MTIKKLIKELKQLDKKDRTVFIYFEENIYKIKSIDNNISDRLDINI